MSKTANETKLLMAQIKNSILDYLTEELKINSDALKPYEGDNLLPDNTNDEVLKIREIEAVKLRDRIHELNRHIAVIKRMIPTGK
ncbi:MAG: hypothetical protein IPJ81_18105 [Chitinophagaceae bacterium]|nr:hypothetical protein [Chitinophagaceae bacterium]